MIPGSDLLIMLGLDIKLSKHVIIVCGMPCEGFLVYIVDINEQEFKSLTDKITKLEESFINYCVEEWFESESTVSLNQ